MLSHWGESRSEQDLKFSVLFEIAGEFLANRQDLCVVIRQKAASEQGAQGSRMRAGGRVNEAPACPVNYRAERVETYPIHREKCAVHAVPKHTHLAASADKGELCGRCRGTGEKLRSAVPRDGLITAKRSCGRLPGCRCQHLVRPGWELPGNHAPVRHSGRVRLPPTGACIFPVPAGGGHPAAALQGSRARAGEARGLRACPSAEPAVS